MSKLYSCTAVQQLINHYLDKGGEVREIQEGSLGYGETVLFGEGLKTAVIKERYINQWSSGHTIRLYNKMPKKYEQYI